MTFGKRPGSSSMRRRYKVGDVFELPVQGGYAYVQITHQHKSRGEVVRLIRGVHSASSRNARDVAHLPTQCVVLYLVGVAADDGVARHVGHAEVPEADRRFPMFRQSIDIPPRPDSIWRVWSGEGDPVGVGRLTADLAKLPLNRNITNDDVVNIIEHQWIPEHGDYLFLPWAKDKPATRAKSGEIGRASCRERV